MPNNPLTIDKPLYLIYRIDNTTNNLNNNNGSKPLDDNKKASANNNKNKNNNRFTVKVAESDSRDVGRRIARIDPRLCEKFGISAGDALELSTVDDGTKRIALVLNWPAYQGDYNKGLIRIDGYTRNKLGVGINDKIEVKKVETKYAISGSVEIITNEKRLVILCVL